MSDSVQCPNCAKRYPSSPKYLGMEVRCKNCGQVFTVSGETQEIGSGQLAASPTSAAVPPKPGPAVPVAQAIEPSIPVAKPVEAAIPEASVVETPVETVVCGELWNDSPAAAETYPMAPMRGGQPLPQARPVVAAPTLADVDKGSIESWLGFLAHYKLALILFAWTLLITVATWFRGSLTFFLLGCVVLAAGIVIALLGFRP